MVASDGADYVHTKLRSTELKDTTHYDKLWKVLAYTELKMLGDHSKRGGHFKLVDQNGIKVGEVTFDGTDHFKGGVFYGDPIIAGRTLNQRAAFAQFMDRVEETHGRR